MATIVSTLFSSLDGVVEIDPAWHFPYFDYWRVSFGIKRKLLPVKKPDIRIREGSHLVTKIQLFPVG